MGRRRGFAVSLIASARSWKTTLEACGAHLEL
jgi:hypothetical protein